RGARVLRRGAGHGGPVARSRHRCKAIGGLSESVVRKRPPLAFLVVIFLLLLMVNAVFGTIIAGEMVDIPTSVFPAWAAIPVAVAIGFLIRKKANLLLISIIGVSFLYFTIYVGSEMPLALPEGFLGMN